MDTLSIEERINDYCNKFEAEGIVYDRDFVEIQVKEQYPWEDFTFWDWKPWFLYHKVFPTKDSKYTQLDI